MTGRLLAELEALPDRASRFALLERHRPEIDEEFLAALHRRVGELLRSDPAAARALAEVGDAAAAHDGRPSAIGRARRALGSARHALGEYEGAVAAYESAAVSFADAGDAAEAARTRVALVDALAYVSRHDDAVRIARETRAALPADPAARAKLEAQLDWNLGNLHHRRDRYEEALASYGAARAFHEREGQELAVAVLDFNRAVVLSVAGDPEAAYDLFRRAREVFSRRDLRALVSQLDYNLSYLHFQRGRMAEALALLDRVEGEFRDLGDRRHLALVRMDRAEILLRLNLGADAGGHAADAAEEFAALGMRFEEGKSRLFAAGAARDRGDGATAAAEVDRAEEIFEREGQRAWVATARILRAEAALDEGDAVRARDLAAQAREILLATGLAARAGFAELTLGRAARHLGDAAAARDLLGGLLAADDPAIRWRARRELGRQCAEEDRRGEARRHFETAAEVVEEMRATVGGDELSAAFLEDKAGVYEDVVLACLADGEPRTALEWVERAKSRTLVDRLAGRAGAAADAEGDRRRLDALSGDLSWILNRIGIYEGRGDQRSREVAGRLRADLERVEREIEVELRKLEVAGSAVAAPAAARDFDPDGAAPAGTALVEYFTADGRILAFVVRAGEVAAAELSASAEEVADLLARLSFQLAKFELGDGYVGSHAAQLEVTANAILSRLHDLLLAELLPGIPETRLVVIPHGPLHGVPFHALLGGGGPLIAGREVAYAPSARVLALCRRRRRAAGGPPLLVGVEDEATPGIAEEIDAIREILPDAVVLRNEGATRSAIEAAAPAAGILHFATHGLFRRESPASSALRLGDSWLGLFDVERLSTAAGLVTLSACDSGRARVRGGDELYGLARGFFRAGASTVLASLWRVNDRSATEYMRSFYREWSRGAAPAAAARRASLSIRERRAHPYYWAPFVVLGHPGSRPPADAGIGSRNETRPPAARG